MRVTHKFTHSVSENVNVNTNPKPAYFKYMGRSARSNEGYLNTVRSHIAYDLTLISYIFPVLHRLHIELDGTGR